MLFRFFPLFCFPHPRKVASSTLLPLRSNPSTPSNDLLCIFTTVRLNVERYNRIHLRYRKSWMVISLLLYFTAKYLCQCYCMSWIWNLLYYKLQGSQRTWKTFENQAPYLLENLQRTWKTLQILEFLQREKPGEKRFLKHTSS